VKGPAGTFAERSRPALADAFLHAAVERATTRLREGRVEAARAAGDWPALREAARALRLRTLRDLDRHLADFQRNVEARGGVVRRARDAAEACAIVVEVARARELRLAAKSKSMLAEEVGLNAALEAAGVEALETDLGEWIIQLAGDTPSHIILPAIHKSRGDVRALFEREGARGISDGTAELCAFARARLRERFLQADLGVSGCNVAVAETGSIALFTNEGNGRMVTTLPRVHVVLMGMERIVPALQDLELLANVLPRAATGQRFSSYLNVVSGPRRPGELDGPEELIVVVVDNGRGRIARDERFASILSCIRCGACLNVCPVYRQVGGHAYGSVYPGPIGAVLSGLLEPESRALGELAQASSLCGACTDACPVGIPLHDLLVSARETQVEQGRAPLGKRLALRAVAQALGSPGTYALATSALRRFAPLARRFPPLARWEAHRAPFELPRRSFREIWDSELEREPAPERFVPSAVAATPAPPRPPPAGPAAPIAERFLAALSAVGGRGRTVRDRAELARELAAEVGRAAGAGVVAFDASEFEGLGLDPVLERLGAPRLAGLSPDAFRARCAAAHVGITTCVAAVAQTGSLLLACAPGRPRSVSLLPRVHVAVVPASRLVETPREAFDRLGADVPSQVVLVTGPSRTGDIEQDLTIGVHGPGEVVALVLEDA
jgi:L-lactate dehydrogenase complex protein LldF